MKNREDKNIEKLVEKIMAETSVESPSIDFTSKVMTGIIAVERNKAFIYKPIISKKVWMIILGIIVVLFAFLIFKTPSTSTDFNLNLNFKLQKIFSLIQFSTLTAIVLFAASVMVFIQAFLLKNFLDKRFE